MFGILVLLVIGMLLFFVMLLRLIAAPFLGRKSSGGTAKPRPAWRSGEVEEGIWEEVDTDASHKK